ncbi:hypothetical protein AWB91_11895 [Mycobacterium paraense]|uniref:Uncharacterized protein n=1 Tax=Mycobacterium paraense TaxID=767916 RepID=A0ABX3VQU8_9MYCO|nr:hypothetical protein [Mycobacterium paraense]ORW32624.1 hypothetical protein AWB91_11895 [Mycobacterium paraense]ORW37972.1 hypothetical protein AWB88_01780 [Mycobacterium paraense]
MRRPIAALLAATAASFGVVIAPPAIADAACGPGGPPPGAAGKDASVAYGQPATLWITNTTVGITTAEGYGEAKILSASPLQRSALLIDAQQDGSHQIIVDAGREAILYTASGCTITPVVDRQGASFRFDLGHRRGNGDGVGCSDLGDGRHLVGLLQLRDEQDNAVMAVRRTEIDLNDATATIGPSDTVPVSSDHDPAWTTASDISCGELTMRKDGVQAPF